jgi:hypothetical protein
MGGKLFDAMPAAEKECFALMRLGQCARWINGHSADGINDFRFSIRKIVRVGMTFMHIRELDFYGLTQCGKRGLQLGYTTGGHTLVSRQSGGDLEVTVVDTSDLNPSAVKSAIGFLDEDEIPQSVADNGAVGHRQCWRRAIHRQNDARQHVVLQAKRWRMLKLDPGGLSATVGSYHGTDASHGTLSLKIRDGHQADAGGLAHFYPRGLPLADKRLHPVLRKVVNLEQRLVGPDHLTEHSIEMDDDAVNGGAHWKSIDDTPRLDDLVDLQR